MEVGPDPRGRNAQDDPGRRDDRDPDHQGGDLDPNGILGVADKDAEDRRTWAGDPNPPSRIASRRRA